MSNLSYNPLTVDPAATRENIRNSKYRNIQRYARERGIAPTSLHRVLSLNPKESYPFQADRWSRYQLYLQQLAEDDLLVQTGRKDAP